MSTQTFDNTQAFAEGWALFDDGEIQRLDETEVFTCDGAALKFVELQAKSGSDYHRQALEFHYARIDRQVLEAQRETMAAKWHQSPEEILNSIDDSNGIGWDTDAVLFILQTFIRTHTTPEQFRAHVQRAAEFDLSLTAKEVERA